MQKSTVLCIIGTRPEAIKMAPVVRCLRARGFATPILVTGQHRHLLDQVFEIFGLKADWDLDAMSPNQGLSALFGKILPTLGKRITECEADLVMAQGDTTTVLAAALGAFHAKVAFGHVEAGLRSYDLSAPFPEEGNRRLTAVITKYHFAPTEIAKQALLMEGTAPEDIHVVGNTVIDSLLEVASRENLPWPPGVPFIEGERRVLVTLHRRENFGAPFEIIFRSLAEFASTHPETRLIYPIHPNPNVLGPARAALSSLPNVHLIEPQDYPSLVNIMGKAFAVFTDSGGIQEEAPALGVPVLVFREVTERPEAVEAGGVRLVGADPVRFKDEAEKLWTNERCYAEMAQKRFPYGDGKASQRIAEILGSELLN